MRNILIKIDVVICRDVLRKSVANYGIQTECKYCSVIQLIGRRILCLTDGEDTRSANKPDNLLDILKVDIQIIIVIITDNYVFHKI